MTTTNITVFVGDIDINLSLSAKQLNTNAELVTIKNYKNLPQGVYYCSLGDLINESNFTHVLEQADRIIYCPPKQWSNNKMRQITEKILGYFLLYSNNVENFNPACEFNLNEMLAIQDKRKTKNKQIWIAGCSISHGSGVSENERYGTLLGKKINLPVSWLTYPGSSVTWAADQIIRADIKENDIVFWGITSPDRYDVWSETDERVLRKKNFDYSEYFTKKFFLSDTAIYHSVIAIHRVIKHCNSIKAKLICATLLSGLELSLKHYKNFINLYGIHKDKFLDLGDDNIHPGSNSHKFYAEKFFELYLNYK